MRFKNKKILVTGGTGFIGSHLCDALLEEGAYVTAFDNLSASSLNNVEHLDENKKFNFILGDVVNRDLIEKYVFKSDIVFHLAASNVGNSVIFPRNDMDSNIVGTFNVLWSARKKGNIRVIHASSGSVANPNTPYAISKLAGEQYAKFFAKEWGVNLTVVRYYHIFGPRQDLKGKCGVINIFLSRILKNSCPSVWGKGKQIKCFTFIKDAINATLIVADSNIKDVYDIASETRINIDDLAKILIYRYADDKNMLPIYNNPKIGENMELYPDVSEVRKLGWKSKYTFEQGLDITEKWVKENL